MHVRDVMGMPLKHLLLQIDDVLLSVILVYLLQTVCICASILLNC